MSCSVKRETNYFISFLIEIWAVNNTNTCGIVYSITVRVGNCASIWSNAVQISQFMSAVKCKYDMKHENLELIIKFYLQCKAIP